VKKPGGFSEAEQVRGAPRGKGGWEAGANRLQGEKSRVKMILRAHIGGGYGDERYLAVNSF